MADASYEARYRRLKWLLSVQQALCFPPNGHELGIDCYSSPLPADHFYRQYYQTNRPVVFKGLGNEIFTPDAHDWDALTAAYGHHVIQAKKIDSKPALNGEYEYTTQPFQAYVDNLRQAAFPEYYITAYDGETNRPFIDAFLKDTVCELPDFLKADDLHKDVYPWIGPAHTITRAHIDLKNGLLVQLIGRKHLVLFPWFCDEGLYPMNHLFTSVDFHNPDPIAHPEFFNTQGIEVVLEPGDAIFLPVTWWHRVEALDPSLSVSFFNFAYPNTFAHPASTYPSPAKQPFPYRR